MLQSRRNPKPKTNKSVLYIAYYMFQCQRFRETWDCQKASRGPGIPFCFGAPKPSIPNTLSPKP